MTLLLVGIALAILMVFITRQLTNSLLPERFRSVIRLLLPAYLLLNLYFTLLMREPSKDRLVTLVPLRSYFAVLGWFEVDDILHNVLGTYLGICLYRRTVKRTST